MNTPLIVGNAYHIRYEDSKHPDTNFVGIGILREINPPNYIDGTLEFKLLNEPTGVELGYFMQEHIGEMAQHPDIIKEQLKELLTYAITQDMTEAVKWLEERMDK
jgi:hypothetical protein